VGVLVLADLQGGQTEQFPFALLILDREDAERVEGVVVGDDRELGKRRCIAWEVSLNRQGRRRVCITPHGEGGHPGVGLQFEDVIDPSFQRNGVTQGDRSTLQAFDPAGIGTPEHVGVGDIDDLERLKQRPQARQRAGHCRDLGVCHDQSP